MSGISKLHVSPLDSVRSSTEATDKLGTIRVELNKIYKYVKLKAVPTAEVDASALDGVCYTDYSAHEVGTDFADIEATNLGAGILVAAIDMSADVGKYVWIQIKGPALLNTAVGGTPVAGIDFQCHASTDLTFTKSVTLVQRMGTYISGTGNEVALDCPF